MKPRYSILTVVLLAFAAAANAQSVCTLADCERMAAENNRKLQNAQFSADAATQTRREAFTNYFPEVAGQGAWFNANHGLARTEIETGGLISPELGAMLPAGLLGALPASVPISLLKNGTFGGVTATLPVFAGGRIVNGNKLAKVGEEAAHLQVRLTEDEVILTTDTYFWQIVNLKEKIETIMSVERMLDGLHRDVATAVEAGMTTENDLLRVKLQIQDLASNRLKVENGIAVCKMRLAQFIGADMDDFDIQYSTDDDLREPVSLYRNPADAVCDRTETSLLDLNVEAAKLKRRISFGEQLPSLGVGGGYLYNDLLGRSNNSGILYASVSIPISGWWRGSHAHKRQKLLQRQAANDRANNIELMTVETRNTWNELIEAHKQLRLAETSIAQAAENLRIVESAYKAGTVPLTDLLDAQLLFRQSRNQYSDAYSVCRVKTLRYQQITAGR